MGSKTEKNEQNKPVKDETTNSPQLPLGNIVQQACDYWIDAIQRNILYFDVLRQRGNTHFEEMAKAAPNVLQFEYEEVLNGKNLIDPVNYSLLRIIPPEGVTADPNKRPFIIFDPRAGHGPGIGGMKHDSEIGVALRAGHPCYFIGFLPYPIEGQTTEDVCAAEAIFVSKVIDLHPNAEKPCLIGNCQAGWQIAMMAAINPDLIGVLILAGAPMSYWAGVHGKNPMRYSGGLYGGSWLTSMASDLGNGRFDGAALIENFEKLNPANTLWKKDYNLYSKVDTEAQRFLEFEKWWGSPILLNGEEIQFIVDELFIGNHLSSAKIHTSSGIRVDIRNIKAPIVVFCSQADDITPPQQALDWIIDLYSSEDEIVANGQTIIYSLHQSIGHLGIFVSSSVATKEHDKFIRNIDMIETLPPGLYEAVFTAKEANTVNPDLASGNYVLRFEKRRLDDIRAIGCNDQNDELCFAAVARISENLQGLYNTFVSPMVRAIANDQMADAMRKAHPNRQRFEFYSDKNPLFKGLEPLAEIVKTNRRPLNGDNIFWAMQEAMSEKIVSALDAYRDLRDDLVEKYFFQVYGSPLLQAAIGLRTVRPYAKQQAGRDVERERGINQKLLELQDHIETGGLAEALVRALLYAGRGSSGMDEREVVMLRRLMNDNKLFPPMPQAEYKALVRKQHMMMLLDEERAVSAIPLLMNKAVGTEKEAMSVIRRVIEADGKPSEEEEKRLKRLEQLLVPATSNLRRRATDPRNVD